MYKINLCIHIIITSCQIYTMHEMQYLALVSYKEHPQTQVIMH